MTAEDRKEEMKSMNRFAGALMSRLLSASKSTATSSAPPSRVSVRLPTKRAHDGPQAKKTYGGRSSNWITSKLLSRQSPGTTPCQSTTGEREQLSAGGRSDTGLPPQGCPRVLHKCKDPFRFKMSTAQHHCTITTIILIIMNGHTLLA
jgi:hypothetical protein